MAKIDSKEGAAGAVDVQALVAEALAAEREKLMADVRVESEKIMADVRVESEKIMQEALAEGKRVVAEAQDLARLVVDAASAQARLNDTQKVLAREQAVNVTAALAECPKVKVRFLAGAMPHEKGPVSFGYLGVAYTVKREEEVLLPEPVVKHLQRCVTGSLVMDGDNRMKRVSVPTLPMQVIEWPAKAAGDGEA